MATACEQSLAHSFLHDVLHVNFYSLFGDEELFGDIAIPISAGNLP
jgi:hypothetical protein